MKWKRLLLPYIDKEHYDSFRIIEIGCGPIGIINYINRGQRYGLDSLEGFYKSNNTLTKLRNSDVQYLEGTGEMIPFEENFFDLVIIDNVLDHVYDANAVVQEIRRVLKQDGFLYMTVNVRTRFGTQVHKFLSRLLIDKGHPQSFDVISIRNLIGRFQFSIRSESVSDFYEARSRDMRSPCIKDNIKGYSGISEFLYYAVCQKDLTLPRNGRKRCTSERREAGLHSAGKSYWRHI